MRKTLVQRIAPYLVRPDERWSTRPITQWLRAWQTETGDTAATIARGFALYTETVTDLLDGTKRLFTTSEAVAVCRALRADPAELWPTRATRSMAVTWPTEFLYPHST
jgi:hypothetical protein